MGEPVSPDYYYEKLEQDFHPITYNMMTNYRSYQGILDAAAAFIPQNERAHLPHSAHSIMKNVPQGRCVRTLDCQPADSERWYEEFDSIVEEAGRNRFQDIAVFFRTKAEVYYGYSLLKEKQYPNVRLRVQGASTCELWRTREMYSIIRYLEMHGGESIVFKDETTKRQIRSYVQNVMGVRPSFDMFYLDLAYALALDFIDSVENEERVYTFADMAAEIKEASNNDDGQLYKIYDKYRAERILSDSNINVVLTTMHKVKGLEFDSVVITPSHVALPLDFKGLPLSSANCEDMEEERRLMFVAYTRARKSLRVYRSCRERTLGFAGEELVGWAGDEAVLGYHDEPGLEKLYLSYLALSNKFACNNFVKSSVVKNAPVSIHSSFWDGRFKGCRVLYDGHPVGFLSTRSRIRERMRIENATMISGLFVNEVLVWTYRDTEEYDRKNGTTFAQQWCDEAKKQGFIYLVDYAGYGR